MDVPLSDLDLETLLAHGQTQTADLTFYKLTFQALEQIAWRNAATPEVYRTSLVALWSGFLASLRPELLPQAVAVQALLLRNEL